MEAPFISIVIPAYNEGQRLPRFVTELTRVFLERPAPPTEFIVVDDGSLPEHATLQQACVEEAQARLTAQRSPHRFSYVAAPHNQGKGSAIRLGWRVASPTAAWFAFVDADGAISAEELHRLVELTTTDTGRDHDVIAGSRILMAGRRVVRNLHRHLQGRVFATLTDSNFQLRFYDTQCGVKLVRAAMLRPLLDVLQEERWLLDVEMLVLLKRQGARAIEVPIDWEDFGGSKVVPGLDGLRMFWGLLQLRRRLERLTLPAPESREGAPSLPPSPVGVTGSDTR
ncbi:glycosyltransferase family 2 protein [Pyxidicoccus fallax]|uniref:dolichyl-phosphate beta-glucosyltransferase n=1 Tax=Pyxidicoccus fallax TaxID=394095 RepID=A0A848L4T2_9BACT|nr:glycosyltransferase family 2 protein [Pyxidicoccus fallax]NPC80797.1 glycosyltransferase family 2 protein [Pyxidicoccus fallax]